MSDVKTDAVEENVMSIKVAQEDKLPYPSVAYINYTLSDEFCKTANPLFKAVFSDFEGFGVWLDIDPTSNRQILTMSAFFNQYKDDKNLDPDKYRAFSYDGKGKDGKESGFARINRFERIAEEGNKFHITDEAKDMIAPFMHPRALTNKGEVNWDRTGVVTYRASQSGFGYSAPITYSVVNFIDPVKILREIYGAKAEIYVGKGNDGVPVTELKDVAYQILAFPVLNNGQPRQSGPEGPFNLYITQVDLENAHFAADAAGINVYFGPRICR